MKQNAIPVKPVERTKIFIKHHFSPYLICINDISNNCLYHVRPSVKAHFSVANSVLKFTNHNTYEVPCMSGFVRIAALLHILEKNVTNGQYIDSYWKSNQIRSMQTHRVFKKNRNMLAYGWHCVNT